MIISKQRNVFWKFPPHNGKLICIWNIIFIFCHLKWSIFGYFEHSALPNEQFHIILFSNSLYGDRIVDNLLIWGKIGVGNSLMHPQTFKELVERFMTHRRGHKECKQSEQSIEKCQEERMETTLRERLNNSQDQRNALKYLDKFPKIERDGLIANSNLESNFDARMLLAVYSSDSIYGRMFRRMSHIEDVKNRSSSGTRPLAWSPDQIRRKIIGYDLLTSSAFVLEHRWQKKQHRRSSVRRSRSYKVGFFNPTYRDETDDGILVIRGDDGQGAAAPLNIARYLELEWVHTPTHIRLVVIHLFILFLIFSLHIGAVSYLLKDAPDINICVTPDCISTSNLIRKSIDESIDPCDDFFSFVCGIQKLPTERTDHWTLQGNNIFYDFKSSIVLERMLKQHYTPPYNMVLPYYKTCLREDERDKEGLKPFYQLLNDSSLLDITWLQNGVPAVVVAKLLADSYKNFIPDADLFRVHVDKNKKTYAILSFRSSKNGYVSEVGFNAYVNTVAKSFQHLKQLNMSEEDINIFSKDVTCLTMFIRDHIAELLIEQLSNGSCSDFLAATTQANFGGPLIGEFNYLEFIGQIYPETASKASKDWVLDFQDFSPQQQEKYGRVNQVIKKSSAMRIARYMQWSFFLEAAFELDGLSMSIIQPIKRSSRTDLVQSCFYSLFYSETLIPKNYFLESLIPKLDRSKKIMEFVSDSLSSISEKLYPTTEFDSSVVNGTAVMELVLEQLSLDLEFIQDYIRISGNDVLAAVFKGVIKEHNSHFENFISMKRKTFELSQLILNKDLKDVKSSHSKVNINILPVSFIDLFHGDQFYGKKFLTCFEGLFPRSSNNSQSTTKSPNLFSEFALLARETVSKHLAAHSDKWKNSIFEIHPPDYIEKMLAFDCLLDQMSIMVANSVVDLQLEKTPWLRYIYLPGLSKYTIRQLFYIYHVLIFCRQEIGSIEELEHMKTQGPIPYRLSKNIQLGNLEHFAETFSCSKTSQMNFEDKINLFQVNKKT